MIAVWLRDLCDDAAVLNRIIEAVAGQTTGAAFERLVSQHVGTARDHAAGSPRLPLPPMSVPKASGA